MPSSLCKVPWCKAEKYQNMAATIQTQHVVQYQEAHRLQQYCHGFDRVFCCSREANVFLSSEPCDMTLVPLQSSSNSQCLRTIHMSIMMDTFMTSSFHQVSTTVIQMKCLFPFLYNSNVCICPYVTNALYPQYQALTHKYSLLIFIYCLQPKIKWRSCALINQSTNLTSHPSSCMYTNPLSYPWNQSLLKSRFQSINTCQDIYQYIYHTITIRKSISIWQTTCVIPEVNWPCQKTAYIACSKLFHY